MQSIIATSRVRASRRAFLSATHPSQSKNSGINQMLTPIQWSVQYDIPAPNTPTRFLSVGWVVIQRLCAGE
jgi:hypothetical protein